MPVSNQIPINESFATPGATEFPFGFKVLRKADMLVLVNGEEKQVDVDYTIDGLGSDSGGTITFLQPMVGGERVLRRRNMPLERQTDFQNLGDLRSATLNNDQDAPILMIQQVNADLQKFLSTDPTALAVSSAEAAAASEWNANQSKLAAAASEVDAEAAAETAVTKAAEAVVSAALAEQARILGAAIGYATKSAMDSDLAHPAGTMALVTNDSNPANNIPYRKTGASGTGSWVPSQDRTTVLAAQVVVKPDNPVDPAMTGAYAALLTEALQAFLIQQGPRTRIAGLSLSDGAELEVRDTEPVRGVAAVLMGKDRKATAYLHQVGDLVLPSAPRPVAQPQPVRSGMAQERDKILGCGHNQWIFPLFASMNGRRYHTSIGQGSTGPRVLGDVQVSERDTHSRWMQYAVARQQSVRNTDTSDDHNAPCILLDPRDEAPFPVMVFGADHSDSSSRLRLWRSRTPDCAALEAPIVVDVTSGITTTGGMSYAQAFRDPYNPDWAYVLSRQGNTSNAVWWLHRSRDGFITSECTRLFAGDDLYLIAKPTRDGLGQHIVIQQHPLNGADQRVLYLRYVFADGSLRDASDGFAVTDVWTSDAFRPFETIGATELYEPEAGRAKRLFDAMETANGKLEAVLVDFETDTYLGDAIHVALEFGNSPVVTEIGGVGSAGYPLELSNSNAYFGGLCLTGEGEVVMARWDRESPGSGELAKWTLNAGTWSKSTVLQTSTGASDKLGRPVVCVDFAWDGERIVWTVKPSLTYLRGTYGSYSNFSFDMTEVSL